MKRKQLFKNGLVFIITLLALSALGKDQSEKKKYLEKSFQVSSSTRLDVSNKFGKVEINTWEKNEFSLKVEMIAKSKSEERAKKILDQISVDFEENTNEIVFKSRTPENKKTKNWEGFEINYVIYMPEDNPLKIKNSFGDVTMGDRQADLELEVSYGSLKTGDLNGNTNLSLSFGNGNVGKTTEGNFTIKYSEFDIEEGTTMDLVQSFSELEIGMVKALNLTSKYGGIEIENAENIEAEAHFSGIDIEELTGSIKMNCSYLGDFRIAKLAKSFTKVDIDGKFGSYELGLEPGLSANIDAEFNFADLDYSSDVDISFRYQNKEFNKSRYKGTIGGGNPDKIIKIDSGYGDLSLEEY